jgi:hypothetical protein
VSSKYPKLHKQEAFDLDRYVAEVEEKLASAIRDSMSSLIGQRPSKNTLDMLAQKVQEEITEQLRIPGIKVHVFNSNPGDPDYHKRPYTIRVKGLPGA